MGAVIEKIDRGKSLRLDSFSFLDTLLKKVISPDEKILHLIIASSLHTYETDMSIDVQIRRLSIVIPLVVAHPNLLNEFAKELAAKFSLENPQWKEYKDKKPTEPENAEKLLTEMLKTVRLLFVSKEELPNSDAIGNLYAGLRKVPRFAVQLEELESNKQ